MKKMKDETIAVRAGNKPDTATGGVNTPIHTSTSYHYKNSSVLHYPRYNNTPNLLAVSEKIAALERTDSCLVFGSGMSAISTALLGLLSAGDHVVFQNDIYGGTRKFVETEFTRRGLSYTFVTDLTEQAFRAACKKETKIIYVESPSNPLLHIVDLAMIARLAKELGILSLADSTMASPVNQKPAELGIDVVLHSGSKYLGGHSDILCGAVCSSSAIMEKISLSAGLYGGTMDANTAYLLERSLKSLFVRVERHNNNALYIAEFLSGHKKVKSVLYPGLPSHPHHELAKAQMKAGFGGVLSFDLHSDDDSITDRFFDSLRMIEPALSFGGVESLITAPSRSSHRSLGRKELEKAGITPTLMRLSCGIEHRDDILDDITTALASI